MKTEEAINEVKEAIEQFGVPCWVAHISCPIRNAVPKEIKKQLLATAKVSEGWSKQFDGQFVFGRTRTDDKENILEWAKQNVFEMVTVKQVADACGVAESCARRTMNARPDVFKKFGKEYEIRDAEADRKSQKK
jgi:hypothetical protein